MILLNHGIIAVMAISLIRSVLGEVISSKLQVHIPSSLSRTDGYEHREALFGIPPYGGSIQQLVYYADDELCDPTNVNTRGGYPEREKDKDGKMKPWPSPYILFIDRGGCSFVNKVRNAQRSGAAGVIIADKMCNCAAEGKDPACVSAPGEICEATEPIMADDGSGSDITIPSFLMFKQDADPIREELKQNHMVRMEMGWSLPNPDARVEYELWTTPTDMISRDFQSQFKAAAVALNSHAYFTPHMYVYDGKKAGCEVIDGVSLCQSLCTNNGKYCATDPDNDLSKGISGADVVKESLRRECIWKLYGVEDGIGAPWWDYVSQFMHRCDRESYFTNEDCVKDAMSKANVDFREVEKCMSDSGGLEGEAVNTILQSLLAEKEASGVVILPATYVNNAALRGALEFATVFKAICSGYMKGSEPEVCLKCAHCGIDEYQCVIRGECPSAKGSVSIQVFAISLVVVVVLFGCVGLIQWQRSQRQMREQVRGIVAEYMPLDKVQAESAGIPLDPSDTEVI
mmetsp:Transcript_14896/g.17101  ORF Transcript_14896/g.17101 Transcript_14896/m.17101 type:complete len:515 (-) Transcript_14896:94-1638(-)